MSDAVQQINEAAARLATLEQDIKDDEATALAHEKAARESRLSREEKKKEAESLRLVLRNARVQSVMDKALQAASESQKAAEQEREAAAKARSEAEELLKRLSEKEKSLDATLAKIETPPAEPQS